LLLARAGLMEGHTVDPGLEEAIQSLIYAAPKTEIKELGTVRTLLAEKYGKEYVLAATENAEGKVNDKVVKKLSVTPPREELVVGYLEEIARAYGVDWPKRANVSPPPELLDDDDEEANDDDKPSGGQKQKVLETPLTADTKDPVLNTPVKKLSGGGPTSPLTVTPPRMTTDNIHPKVTLGSVELKPSKKAERKSEPDGSVPDLGDLERRFAALKKR
ncbi:hypothetical protein F66182_8374, partial [Fusarium sp. NRRL 66182]